MKLRLWSLPLIVINVLLFAPAALALRCGSNVIDAGMRKIEVEQKCGPPASQDSHVEHRTVRKRRSGQVDYADQYSIRNRYDRESQEVEETIDVVVEEWVYNFGSSRFMQLLVFEDGRLKEVKDLGYGH
jgi:hypothetical protein